VAYLLSELQGNPLYGLFPADGNALERIANFFWGWDIRMRTAPAVPFDSGFPVRLAEAIRLWHWAVPGLPLLAAAGWWMGRRDPRVLLLGLSFRVHRRRLPVHRLQPGPRLGRATCTRPGARCRCSAQPR
jgi:hypothetical protein